ncbi:uncharacterized protein BDCG_04085 [Blastomyces dermatitidis ER-3]|uniref:Uncharacterized protein n=2 Tax=Blastomyces TaxID=229219 RepID=A0A179UBZ9_BLAGS|nr:uncharacterized protein BDBG_01076 [Blastomyces gilchristii SLH14081]XP_045275988.1 uncharacterized protein BDCG_04085 [Blastomyces dermatitidis ER-3]EEQ88965.1 hypothetical protein BDCG_04085 [Blastomyces dermatitidis ER-3]EQL32722.1 hypothetical protein BDFG_05113 [Blastomyces dermatitidis ATCC 26199]OAT04541.1 hypothetical protein BDBG_01076 [Blastomyces gilchristii SLH14081]
MTSHTFIPDAMPQAQAPSVACDPESLETMVDGYMALGIYHISGSGTSTLKIPPMPIVLIGEYTLCLPACLDSEGQISSMIATPLSCLPSFNGDPLISHLHWEESYIKWQASSVQLRCPTPIPRKWTGNQVSPEGFAGIYFFIARRNSPVSTLRTRNPRPLSIRIIVTNIDQLWKHWRHMNVDSRAFFTPFWYPVGTQFFRRHQQIQV